MIEGTDHIDKEYFLFLYPKAREAAFTFKNICSGFSGAGLKPLNKERVLEESPFTYARHHLFHL
jgi:hypothetical protein